MLQTTFREVKKDIFPEQAKIAGGLPVVYGNGIPCEQEECIYCLENHYCCRAWPPRNQDGYCKNFISIND